MDPILNAIKVVSSAPMPRKSAADVPAPAPNSSDIPELRIGGSGAAVVDVEEKRTETVRSAANRIAVAPTTFVMFKGNDGQIITRFRDGNTGKVTYIPEPQLLRLSQSSQGPNVMLEA